MTTQAAKIERNRIRRVAERAAEEAALPRRGALALWLVARLLGATALGLAVALLFDDPGAGAVVAAVVWFSGSNR